MVKSSGSSELRLRQTFLNRKPLLQTAGVNDVRDLLSSLSGVINILSLCIVDNLEYSFLYLNFCCYNLDLLPCVFFVCGQKPSEPTFFCPLSSYISTQSGTKRNSLF